MFQSALLFYIKLKSNLELIWSNINPYDPCIANRIIKGTQHTIVWHVDDLKSSHELASVNKNFHDWLNEIYANKILVS
jgi:hypothetical protein